MLAQAGWVGGGVGMMMVAAVGAALGVSGEVNGAQESRKNKAMDKKDKIVFRIDSLGRYIPY
jgi:hypothetical protein